MGPTGRWPRRLNKNYQQRQNNHQAFNDDSPGQGIFIFGKMIMMMKAVVFFQERKFFTKHYGHKKRNKNQAVGQNAGKSAPEGVPVGSGFIKDGGRHQRAQSQIQKSAQRKNGEFFSGKVFKVYVAAVFPVGEAVKNKMQNYA